MTTSKKNKVIIGKAVKSDTKKESEPKSNVESGNIFDPIINRFKNFDRQNNIHMIVGVVLLLIGLYMLRSWIAGLTFLIVGILFVTGYFEKK